MPVPVGGCTAVPHEVKKKEAFTRRALQMPGVTATTVLGAAFLQPYRSESVPISVSRERNGGARPLSLRFCIRAARKPCPFSNDPEATVKGDTEVSCRSKSRYCSSSKRIV